MGFSWICFEQNCIDIVKSINTINYDYKIESLRTMINTIPDKNDSYFEIKAILFNLLHLFKPNITNKDVDNERHFSPYLELFESLFKNILSSTVSLKQIQNPSHFTNDLNHRENIEMIKRVTAANHNMMNLITANL